MNVPHVAERKIRGKKKRNRKKGKRNVREEKKGNK